MQFGLEPLSAVPASVDDFVSNSSGPVDESESAEKLDFEAVAGPDGGLRGWLTVVGSALVFFGTFGYVYSFGVYQDYYTRVFLNEHSPSSISWIGGFQLMMPFALGIVSGKLFDAGYFHHLEIVGGTIFTFSLFMLSLAKPHQYYQVFLSQGVGMGLGMGLTFVPTNSICVRHFRRHRALVTGISISGSAIGAVIFPIMLNHLIPKVGFGAAVRATAYICAGSLVIGNSMMRMPLVLGNVAKKPPPPNVKGFFKDAPYMWALSGIVTSLFGFYFPVVYLQLFAVEHAVDNALAFYSLAIMNGAGVFGRVLGNFLADLYGPWNIQVPCTLITGATIWAVLGVHNKASLLAVSILYGIFSGAWLSLSIASIAALAARPEETGARIGLVTTIGSITTLVSAPIQGALLTANFYWIRPIAFSGSVMFLSFMMFTATRMLASKRKGTWRV